MGIFFAYILKVSVCLALFYLFYKILLVRETFHKTNRIVAICIIAVSFSLPALEPVIKRHLPEKVSVTAGPFIEPSQTISIPATSPLQSVDTAASAHNHLVGYLVLLYFARMLFFLLRSLNSLVKIKFIIRNNPSEREDDCKLVMHRMPITPFSFFDYIVISEEDLNQNGREIICHEKAHIRHYHTIDLLLAEICLLLQWFNPAAWLMKQEIKNLHEYQADSAVLEAGIDIKSYQLLLIRKAVGDVRFNMLTNYLNHTELKKRVGMMLRQKSSPRALLKYLVVILAAFIGFTVLLHPAVSRNTVKISDFTFYDLLPDKSGESERYDVSPGIDAINGKSSHISVTLSGDYTEPDSAEPAHENTKVYNIGGKRITVASTYDFNLDELKVVLVNGKPIYTENFDNLGINSLGSFSVSTGDFSKLYGEAARYGIIEITD